MKVQYKPEDVEDESLLTWRGWPLSPMPSLIPIPPGFHAELLQSFDLRYWVWSADDSTAVPLPLTGLC